MRGCLLSLFWASLVVGQAYAATQVANGVMVIVDEEVITYQDVMRYVQPAFLLLERQYRSRPKLVEQRKQEALQDAVEQLVERRLILHEFKSSGYNLPESIIEDRVQKRIRDNFGGDRVRLTKTLQNRGMSFETFREQIREDIIISAMRARNISQDLIISPYKIERYYVEHLDE